VTYADDSSVNRSPNGSVETEQPRLVEPYPAEPEPEIPAPVERPRTAVASASPTAVASAEPDPNIAEPDPNLADPARSPREAEPSPREAEPAGGANTDYGYANAAHVAGRPMTEIVYWFALALAAGADVAAFHQVVSLILRDQGDALVWLMVVGLTGIALTLAHFAGRLARDVTAGYGTATWKQVFACAIPWVALGLAAFTVRLIVADSSGGTTVDGSVVAGGDIGRQARQASGAVLFLVLYVGSGAVAAFGEFLSRNPLRSGYRQALRAHDQALARLSRSQPPYELAVQVYRQSARSRAREEANWQAAREQRLAHADELKRYAAVLIAAHLQDPTVTDAMTLPDRRPIAGQTELTSAGEARPAIGSRRSDPARPAIEARPADGPQRSIPASETTTSAETVPRHGPPAVVATIPANEDTPQQTGPAVDRTRDGGWSTG
jgi:hypothetical protein